MIVESFQVETPGGPLWSQGALRDGVNQHHDPCPRARPASGVNLNLQFRDTSMTTGGVKRERITSISTTRPVDVASGGRLRPESEGGINRILR
jgi:hypothetical protein